MRLTCSRTDLLNSLNAVARVIASNHPQPVLRGVLLNAKEDLFLTGYDSETGIESKVKADILEKGKLVANCATLQQIVKNLTSDEIYLETDSDATLKIECGADLFRIKYQDCENYPELPEVEHNRSLSLENDVFKSMIRGTIFSVSVEESKPVYTGIKVEFKDHNLTLCATDGFRIAVRQEHIEMDINDEFSFTVPAKTMNCVSQTISDDKHDVIICSSHNFILFDNGSVKIISRLIQGEFLDYRCVIPQTSSCNMAVDTKNLLRAVENSSIVIDEEKQKKSVKLKVLDQDSLEVSSISENGGFKTKIGVIVEGDCADADFNPKMLIDALKSIDDEKINLLMMSDNLPCLIKPYEGDKFLYMIMPLNTRSSNVR